MDEADDRGAARVCEWAESRVGQEVSMVVESIWQADRHADHEPCKRASNIRALSVCWV